MSSHPITPDTPVEELAVSGQLSLRALKVLQRAGLQTVRDVAAYHKEDACYRTLGGCGLKTRRELNGLIKAAYGTLQVRTTAVTVPPKMPQSWQARWLADEASDNGSLEEMELTGVAADLEQQGVLTLADRRYAARCREYALFIRDRHGIPQTLPDVSMHRWFLQQSQSALSAHRSALFHELCRELGML